MSRNLVELKMDDAIGAADMQIGDTLSGTFAGTRTFNYDDEKVGYVYELTQEDGTGKSIFGTANLNHWMKQITVGSFVEITYQGKKKFKGSPQPAHQFSVKTDNAGSGPKGGLEASAEKLLA